MAETKNGKTKCYVLWSYRALQFTVRAAKHRRAADEVEKVMRRYFELAVQSNNKVMLRMGVLSIILFIWEKKSA